MKYSDIPRFTRPANYKIHLQWSHLLESLQKYQEEKPGLDIDPDFQRAHVWTKVQQRAYVEYVLRGGTTGKEILLNCKGWMSSFEGPFVLVDGKQRLEAVTRFLQNRLKVFGHFYKDFEGKLPSDCHFYVFVNDLPTRKQVLNWYLEINSTGTPHTEAELQKVRDMLRRRTM